MTCRRSRKCKDVKPHQPLTNEERRARLEQLGMDCLVECPFVDEVMHMTPEAFIKEILVDKLHAKKLLWERISVLATREAAQPKC